jgi:sulfate/thiosulfate transport system ATP-binding protein
MSIEVVSISKSFGTFAALRDVSLHVPTGKLVALLGPSGSGKTTLLRIISGLEQPDPGSGAIRFHQEDMRGRPIGDRHAGFVFQHYALFRHMTVFDNISFGLRVRPRSTRPSPEEIRARVESLLELVQMRGLAHRRPNQLSGGQRQRVALARALAVEPKILLLDEPFGALDAKVRKELRAWLRRLHDQIHVTTVFVTHDQDEALEVSDQVVVMNAGRIEQVGTPDDVFHHPASEFVMDFRGDVNRFSGRVSGGRVRFASADVAAPDGMPEGIEDTTGATVLVRPHDLELSREVRGPESFEATVMRIHSAGPTARLELRTHDNEDLVAHLSLEQLGELAVEQGMSIIVTPRRVRVFSDGAGI